MKQKLFGDKGLCTIVAIKNLATFKDFETHFDKCQGSTFLPLRSRYLCLNHWVLYINLCYQQMPSLSPSPCSRPSPQSYPWCCYLFSVQAHALVWHSSRAICVFQGILWAVKSLSLEFNASSLRVSGWAARASTLLLLTTEVTVSMHKTETFLTHGLLSSRVL